MLADRAASRTGGTHPEVLGLPTAAMVLILREGKGGLQLLVGMRQNKNNPGRMEFSPPGGKIKPGELPEKAAIREAREETGKNITLSKKIGELPLRDRDGIDYLTTLYVSYVPSNTEIEKTDGEFTDFQWVDVLMAPTLLLRAKKEAQKAGWRDEVKAIERFEDGLGKLYKYLGYSQNVKIVD